MTMLLVCIAALCGYQIGLAEGEAVGRHKARHEPRFMGRYSRLKRHRETHS